MTQKIFAFYTALGLLLTPVSALAVPAAQVDGEVGGILVLFGHKPGPNEIALVENLGGRIDHKFHIIPGLAVANLPFEACGGLLRNPHVLACTVDGTVHAIDVELDNAWGVKRIGSGTVHDGGNKGTGVKVAVIDSGIDYTHPDLDGNYAGGYDFVNEDTDPMDDNGHGTHVAGTIAAEDDGAGVVGVAPEAKLYALKVLNSSGSGSWSDVIAALDWAVLNGIQITNNSYGSGSDPGAVVKAAFDSAAAEGLLHIAAAGNSGTPPGKGDNVGYPARYASVVAVAATNQSDSRASFSSTGPDVELSAPGVSINSTKLGGGYVEFSGTSMASPHVAGAAALVIAAGIADADGDGLINGEIRQVMNDTAEDLGTAGRDEKYGFGLVAAAAAVASVGPPPPTGSISGTVVDADTLLAVEGATVTDGTRSALTDIDGNYVVSDVPEGTYTVTASAGGYESASQSDVMVIADSATIVDFALTPSAEEPPPPEGDTVSVDSIAYLTEGGRFGDRHLNTTVAVVDDLGNPVGGASVSITLNHDSGTSWSGSGTTGSDGTVVFSLKNAPAGCYETEVTDVVAEGLTWDGATPENSFCKL